MNVSIKAPIVLIAFNRPDTTKIAFESIRKVKPETLYVAIDGPRRHKPGEAELCNQVLKVTKDIDWDCQVKYLVREENLGCKYAVSGAISWALENEDRVIVIEDDIVAPSAFFNFAEELLEKYKDDDRIAMISGNNYTPIKPMDGDYLFSKYGHIWGWATWKRQWGKFNVEVPEIQDAVETDFDKMQFINKQERKFYKKYFKKLASRIANKTENSWAPQFMFFRYQNRLLSIVPKVNLASNIGVISSRINAITRGDENFYPADETFNLKKYPEKISENVGYDKYHFNTHINKSSFVDKAIYKIRNYKN
jgi:hypothetical protein